jgi:ParB family chromosome partitioning protein
MLVKATKTISTGKLTGPAVVPPAAPLNDLRTIAIDLLHESKWNPRRHFDEKALAELVESIRQHGVLTPLLVRPDASGYEIAAGHRRLRAARAAGLPELPAIVRDMTDQQFLEVMTLENLQREDIHPIEEADGYQRLIELYGYTPTALAERVGRSESYIAKRLALSKLIEPAKQAFTENRIQLGHAILLARLQPDDQKCAMEKGLWKRAEVWNVAKGRFEKVVPDACSVSELDGWIRDNIYLNLSSAAWRKDDATLLAGAGACISCAKRTGANGLLFDDMSKGDMCLDAACFAQKRDNHLIQVEKAAEEKGAPLLRISRDSYRVDAKADKLLANGAYCVVEGKNDHCEHMEKALIAAGSRDVGKLVDVCRTKACKKHGRCLYMVAAGAKDKPFAKVWKDKKAKLDERIALELKRELWHQVVHDVPEEFNRPEMELVGRKLTQRAGHDGRQALCGALSLEGEKHKQYNGYDFEKPLVAHMQNLEEKDLPGFLVGLALYGSLCYGDEDLIAAAKLYEIDVKAVEATIATPLRAEFEKKKAKAAAANAAKEKAAKKAAKKVVPQKQAKAAGKKAAKKIVKAKMPKRPVTVVNAEASNAEE